MSTELLNAFLAPAQTVWANVIKTPLRFWRSGTETTDHTMSELTAVIEVVGSVQGTVLYTIDGPDMRAISRKMIENQTISPDINYSHLSPDALAEACFLQIAQMVTAESIKILRKTGMSCILSSARLLKPKGSPLGRAAGQHMVVAFRSTAGNLKIRIHNELVQAATKAA